MAHLIVPIGIPGSGKTTWTKNLFPDYQQVSSDAIRLDLYGNAPYDRDKNPEVFARYHETIRLHLLSGASTVADATNLRDYARENLRLVAGSARIHYVVFTNVAQAVQRNLVRKTTDRRWWVPDAAMIGFVDQYEKMLHDIKTEKYDSLTFIERTV